MWHCRCQQRTTQQRANDGAIAADPRGPAKTGRANGGGVVLGDVGILQDLRADSGCTGYTHQRVEEPHRTVVAKHNQGS